MGDVSFSGPFFDGRAEVSLLEGVIDARDKVAERGKSMVQAAFSAAIRNNHGRFLSSITVTDHSGAFTSVSGHHSYTLTVDVPADTDAVTTDLATYGPWLEGVGSRNGITRFGGYHGFRQAGQELDGVAGGIADQAFEPYVEKMN